MKIKEEMKIAQLNSSLENRNEYSVVIASLSTLQEEMATWQYVTNVLIEKKKRLRLNERLNVIKSSEK